MNRPRPLRALVRLFRRRQVRFAVAPYLLRAWAARSAGAAAGADFLYDVRLRQVTQGPPAVAQALDGACGVLYVYPVQEGNAAAAMVFVTATTPDWTTGYLVQLGPRLPRGHRPGAFWSLDPVGDRVFRFESP